MAERTPGGRDGAETAYAGAAVALRGVVLTPFPKGAVEIDEVATAHMIGLNPRPMRARTAFDDAPLRETVTPGDSRCWLPAGARFRQVGETGGAALLVTVSAGADGPLQFERDRDAAAISRPRDFAEDALSARLGRRLLRALAEPWRDALLIEELTHALLARTLDTLEAGRDVAALSPRDPRLRAAMAFMQDRIETPLTLVDIAAAADLSAPQLSRLFRDQSGQSVWAWLTRARCARARALLLSTERPLAEIALDAGFCDQAHLTRVMRRTVGVTPGALRPRRPRGGARA